jgi:hypothetical protein
MTSMRLRPTRSPAMPNKMAPHRTRNEANREGTEGEQSGNERVVGSKELLIENQNSASRESKEIVKLEYSSHCTRDHQIYPFSRWRLHFEFPPRKEFVAALGARD